MPTFAQAQDTEQVSAIHTLEGTGAIRPVPQIPNAQPYLPNDRADVDSPGALVTNDNNKSDFLTETFPALEAGQSSGGFDWFEDFHVVPRAFDFGNLLSPQSTPIEVFNAFRRESREWTSFVNGAGAGTSLGGLPVLPTIVDALSGVPMTVDVSTTGDPFVDATLDFGFSGLGTIFVQIDIQRIVLWGIAPEQEHVEALGFLTRVYPSKDGTEKRESTRKAPRQSWNYAYLIDEGTVAQTLENLLFDFHSRTFGVPVWFEETTLTDGEAAGASTITVGSTDFRDFRVGGLVVILTSQSIFDVLEIATGGITATTLTFTSPTVNAYNAGTRVYPLATCFVQANLPGSRWPVNLGSMQIRFQPTDNDVDLGDLSAFGSFNGKLLLDNGNSMPNRKIARGFQMKLVKIDGLTGLRFQDSTWDRHKRGHFFTLRADGQQAVWEMRRMIHGIKGRWISFYVPTDSDDLVAVADLLSASDTIDVTNVGYAQFVRNRQPKNVIRVNFVDGSTPILRTVISSTNISSTVDRLTVDDNWPSTITPAEISRIDYVEKLRFDTDNIQIKYDRAAVRARMIAPVKAVFE